MLYAIVYVHGSDPNPGVYTCFALSEELAEQRFWQSLTDMCQRMKITDEGWKIVKIEKMEE